MRRARLLPPALLCLFLLYGCATVSRPNGRVQVATAGFVTTNSPSTAVPTAEPPVAESPRLPVEALVHALVNEVRTERGACELALREDLCSVARRHAQDMANRGYFSHYSPEGTGPGDRARSSGLEFGAFAENLARIRNADHPARLAIRGWIQSPGHRRNLFDEGKIGYRYTGIGAAVADDGSVFVAQVFLR